LFTTGTEPALLCKSITIGSFCAIESSELRYSIFFAGLVVIIPFTISVILLSYVAEDEDAALDPLSLYKVII